MIKERIVVVLDRKRKRFVSFILLFVISCIANSQCLTRRDSIRISDSLFTQGYELYKAKRYSQALPIFEELFAIDTLLYQTEHYQRKIYSGMWLGNTLYKLGREKDAQANVYTSLYYKASPVDPRMMNEVDSLAFLAQTLERAKLKNKDDVSDDDIMTLLGEYAQRYKSGTIGENDIISLYKKRGELLDRLLPKHHIWAANNNLMLASQLTNELKFYASVSNPYEKDSRYHDWYRARDERDSLYLNYVESVKLLYGERSLRYINALITSYNILCKDQVNTSDVGINLLRNSYNLCLDVLPSDTISLITSTSFLGEACRLRAEEEYKKTLKLSNTECADILVTSINYYMDADSAYNYVLQYANCWQDEVWAYKKKAGCFFSLANISSRLQSSFFSVKDNTFYYNSDSVANPSHTKYIEQVNAYNFIDYIAQGIRKQGNDRTREFDLIKIGLNYIQDAIDSYGEPEDSSFSFEDYSQLWTTLARKQSEAHLFAESAKSFQYLSQMSLTYGDFDTYFQSMKEAISQYHSIYSSSHDLGVLNQVILAGDDFLSAVNDSSINASIKNRDYVYHLRTTVIGEIASAYFDIGEATHDKQAYLKALPHVKEYLDSCVQNRNWGNPAYYLAMYAECLWQSGETDEGIRLALQQQETTFHDCANMLLFSQRKVREQIVDYDISQFDLYVKRAFQRREQIGAGILAYNKELFTKGLLVNSERLLMDFVYMHSDDDLLHELFDQWELVKNEANSEDAYDTYKADSLESMLLIRCKELGNYNEAVLVDWTQVKKNLRAKDIAIEFAKFPIESGIQYVAITLTKKDSEPQIVPLFMESDIQKIPTRDYYRQDDITRLVWGPIYDKLKGAKNVYFAPAGVLYNINIESLPQIGKSSLMSDRWNMYRLSSTKELVWKKDKISVSRAAVYGGLQYDTDTATLIKNQKDYSPAKRQSGFILQDALTKYIAHRGAIETIAYLPATKKEAEAINRELASSQIDNQLYVDEYGTEESFKNLSGKDINILHIATHGFYWTPQEATQMGDLSFLSLTSRYSEDKSLIRSGLLFAGANNAWSGISVPEGLDDGILTAMEVSSLDLRKVDLIVLSACQTAQGEIMSDGVFGLQRGFKKAGAQSILMSLWKVDDEATCMLMTEFYKNWIGEKMTKHDALEAAKQTVRSHKEKGWDDPKYWAAFILLDALD